MSAEHEIHYCYIGVKPGCLCVEIAVCIIAGHEKSTAQTVGEMILAGLTVEKVTTDEARRRLKKCKCQKLF